MFHPKFTCSWKKSNVLEHYWGFHPGVSKFEKEEIFGIYIKEKYKEPRKFKKEQPNIKQEDIWVGFIKKCVREKYSCWNWLGNGNSTIASNLQMQWPAIESKTQLAINMFLKLLDIL